MFSLRKFRHATRGTSRTPNRPRLRLHTNPYYGMYDRFMHPANDSRYKRGIAWRYSPLFHDARVTSDPLLDLFSPGQIGKRYAPIFNTVAEGQIDNRYFNGSIISPLSDGQIAPSSPARIPARIRGTEYIVAPSSPVVESSGPTGAFYSFTVPQQVMVCVRRKQRKEVMHALGHAGSRKRQAKPKRNETSYIRC